MAAGLWPRAFGHDFRHSEKLWVFPLAAGASWFSTLTILLLRWLALGRPRYPGQVNPEIPFVSDIAAFSFQPVFIVGSAVTGVAFAGTVFAVHHVRYSRSFYGVADDAPWRQAASLLALLAGLLASVCLVCLAIFDTFENNDEHRYILICTFGGLGLASVLTAVVWWDQAWGAARFTGLRKWCVSNTFLVVAQTALGFSFTLFLWMRRYRVAGFLEWSLCYVGSVWLASFVGYVRFRKDTRDTGALGERQPLLDSAA